MPTGVKYLRHLFQIWVKITLVEKGSDEVVEIINIVKYDKNFKRKEKEADTMAGVIFGSGVVS